MVKRYTVFGIVIAIVITFVFPLCLSCNKDYLEITDEDFIVSNIPHNWSTANKDEIAKDQEIEEKNVGYDPNRIKANVLFSAGLNRGDGNSYPHVVIEVIPLGNFKTLNEIINYNESIYKKHFKGYERIYINYSQDNTMAILMYQYYGNSDTLLTILDGWALNKSVVWRIGCTSLAGEFEKDASIFCDILSSFVIKDGNITFGEISIR
jgi:hypothetical protein